MLEEIIPGVFAEKATSRKIEMSPATLISRAEDNNLPDALSLDQIQQLLGKKWSEILEFEDERMETLEKNRFSFLEGITDKEKLRISFDGLTMVIEKADFKRYLEVKKQWPLPEDCRLSNWWSDDGGKTSTCEEKFNRVADQYLFELWQECGKPEIGGFKEEIKARKDHKNKSPIGPCYGTGTKGKNQWTFELVVNGAKKTIPYSTLGNKVRNFKKHVNHPE